MVHEYLTAALTSVVEWATSREFPVEEYREPLHRGDYSISPPQPLASLYREFSDGYVFYWTDNETEDQGIFEYLSFQSSVEARADIHDTCEWILAREESSSLEKPVATAHKKWWPFVEEGNGDYLCLDENGRVVWFEHDWMDTHHPSEKFVLLAENLESLVQLWGRIYFARPESLWWGTRDVR